METRVGNHVAGRFFVFSLVVIPDGEKMYSQNKLTKQFPVRLSIQLQQDFDRISNETHINKTTLVRLAIENLVRNIDEKGICEQFKSIQGV